MQLQIGNIKITHEFHVIENFFPIKTDGIIGTDFLQKYLCNINYETATLEIRPDDI